jgi:hypothetical protein
VSHILTHLLCRAISANVNAAALATAKAFVSGGAQASAFAPAISRAISKYGCQTVEPALARTCLAPCAFFMLLPSIRSAWLTCMHMTFLCFQAFWHASSSKLTSLSGPLPNAFGFPEAHCMRVNAVICLAAACDLRLYSCDKASSYLACAVCSCRGVLAGPGKWQRRSKRLLLSSSLLR